MSAPAARRLDCDLLRVLSMLGVVYLHTASGALRQSIGPLWHFSNLVTSLATAAVPLFFMLSGALLLNQPQTASLHTLFRRRLPKLLVPLLAWSALVLLLMAAMGSPHAALEQLTSILGTPVRTPYWFLYALIVMYLLSPLLRELTVRLSDRHWDYMMLLWFVFVLLLNTLRDLAPAGPWKTAFTVSTVSNLNFVGGYLGYFPLGAWLARKRPPSRPVLWAAAAVSYAVIAVGTWRATLAAGAYSEVYKSYLHIFCAVLACALFQLARSYAEHRQSGRAITALSGLSFGIYLVHPLAIEFWQKVWTRFITPAVDTIPIQLGYYLAILLSSLAGIWVLTSIKPLCWVFTGQKFSTACRECNLFALLRRKEPS